MDINTYLTKYNNNTTRIDNSKKDATTGKLTGRLELKNYPNLTDIFLVNNELEEVIIVNCPNLKTINVTNNKITELDIKKIKTDNDTEAGNPTFTDQLIDLSIG